MRLTHAATLLCLLPAVLSQPATAQVRRGPVYLSLMGEPFTGSQGVAPLSIWMAVADTDKNGSISLAELAVDADRFFQSLDVDKDGRIGGEEMTRYEQQIAPAAVRAAGGMRGIVIKEEFAAERSSPPDTSNPRANRTRAPGSGADGQETPSLRPSSDVRQGIGSIPQPVAMTDTDMSGSVTPEEFTRAATRRFAAADANKNGLLDTSELGRHR